MKMADKSDCWVLFNVDSMASS